MTVQDAAAIGLPQYADLLFSRGSFDFHVLGYFLKPQTNITSGPDFGGLPHRDGVGWDHTAAQS